MKILITGGAGFIGSNLSEQLISQGHKVRVVDNLITGYRKNINHLLHNPNFEFIYGDITNLETCRIVTKNIDAISHQAALGSVPRSIDNPLGSHNNNVNGFFNILISAKENNVKRVVFASSSSVYGDEKTLPKKEDKIGKVLSPYACTKKINELYCDIFTKCYDMEVIGLRYFNIFGPKQDPKGDYAAIIPKFIDKIMNNESPQIYGDGTYSRDFTYIDNAVNANILALSTNNKECFGEVFNIANGGRISILEIFNKIKTYLDSDINVKFIENRKGDIPHSNADISKAKKYLDYEPKIPFEQGIKKTIKYYLKLNYNKNSNELVKY